MYMKLTTIAIFITFRANYVFSQYEPTWESLDSRPIPSWFDHAKVGIFIHWGVFSVPSIVSEWFWNRWKTGNKEVVQYMHNNFKPNFTYPEFGPGFTAEFFDPDYWADLFEASGAKYVVLTSKHVEGYTLWPSKFSWNWNAKDVGPNRDLVGDLANSIRKRTDLIFGLYHCLYEWYHPLYLQDKANNYTTNSFVTSKTMPELKEIVMKYKPSLIWSDGEYEASDNYWQSKQFLAWLYNDSPIKDTVVTNDRWGQGTPCKHGGYFTCHDKYNPGVLQKRKWENCLSIDLMSWGYRRNAKLSDYLTINDLISELASTISCGGNILINIGPTRDGIIMPIFEERLRQLGSWLKINGEAVYGSIPWVHQNDTITTNIWYTAQKDKSLRFYAFVLKWPKDNTLILGAVQPGSFKNISMLGVSEPLQWKAFNKGIKIQFPLLPPNHLPSPWAWVLKFIS